MSDVFISYSHADASLREAVVQKLETAGIQCWYAPRNIQPGEEWADAIINGLKNSKVMILIFTSSSNASVQVLREVGLAVDFKKAIIPFKCDETMPSGSMQYYLSTLHWMDSAGTKEQALDELLELTRKSLSGENRENTPSKNSESSGKKKLSSQKLILWIAAAFLVLNIALGIFLYTRNHSVNNNNAPTGISADEELSQLIADGVVLRNGEDIRQLTTLYGLRWTVINNKLYYFSTDYDSPGADNYLVAILDDNTVMLNKYIGPEVNEIVIPEIVDGLPVTVIGDGCFENNTILEKVTIPDTTDSIGIAAFAGCTALKEVIFPAILIQIDESAFAETGLINVRLPDSVETIGAGTFMDCNQLETVFLPEKVHLISPNTFQNDPALKSVTIAAKKVFIDVDAFYETQNVTLIGAPGSYTETFASTMGLKFKEIK